MREPEIGESVQVWPRSDIKVQVDGIFGRYVTDGQRVVWSDWYHRRFHDGSLSLTDPKKKAAPLAPAVTPSKGA